MLAQLLFEKYVDSPSDKRGVVLLDADARVLRTELILDPELHAQWYTPRLLDAVCGDACTLVPFSYKPSAFAEGDPRDVKLVLTMTKWLRQFGLKLHDHLMLFSDGRWRSYGAAGHVDGVLNPAADNDPTDPEKCLAPERWASGKPRISRSRRLGRSHGLAASLPEVSELDVLRIGPGQGRRGAE